MAGLRQDGAAALPESGLEKRSDCCSGATSTRALGAERPHGSPVTSNFLLRRELAPRGTVLQYLGRNQYFLTAASQLAPRQRRPHY